MDKIQEFIEKLDGNPSLLWEEAIIEAIQFGSELTAERAKEKVENVEDIFSDPKGFWIPKDEVLQAIEESVIK